MILRRGSRGEQVKALQRALKQAGFDPGPIDGIFESRTERAVRAYEESQGFRVDGIVGNRILSSLSIEPVKSTADPADYTDNPNTRFVGKPGHPQVWDVDGTWYLMYEIPGSDPPIPVLFSLLPSDRDTLFGNQSPRADLSLTPSQLNSTGAVIMGSADQVPNKEGDMWAGFTERMERARQVWPWLEDPDTFAMYGAAFIEGRIPERWELETTDWWQTHNEAEREWMWLTARDPEQAERLYESNQIDVYRMFQQFGMGEIPQEIVEYMATEFTQGRWSRNYMEAQAVKLAGGRSRGGLDRGLRKFIRKSGLEVTRPSSRQSEVRDLWRQWLGPAHQPSEKQIQRWAARWRENPTEARADLENKLRKQRMALWPNYEDDSLTYDDIAAPWRNVWAQMWGSTPDETDPVFDKLLRNNDRVLNEQLLRGEGLKRGNRSVTNSLLSGMMDSIGGPVTPL